MMPTEPDQLEWIVSGDKVRARDGDLVSRNFRGDDVVRLPDPALSARSSFPPLSSLPTSAQTRLFIKTANGKVYSSNTNGATFVYQTAGLLGAGNNDVLQVVYQRAPSP